MPWAPRLITQKPVMPSSLRAFITADSPSALLHLLSRRVRLLRHDLAPCVSHQVVFGEAALCVVAAPVPDLAEGSGLHLFRHTFRLLHLSASDGSLRCPRLGRFGGFGCLRLRGSAGFASGLSGRAFGGLLGAAGF